MASSKIKGITIEIGGNTSKLQDALKDVDKQVYGLNSDLKALNQALKLDPKNTELLAQKQEVLARNIAATKSRLDTLKEAQRQMGSYNNLTEQQKESYNQLSLEIAKAENALKNMNEELENSGKKDLSGLTNGLKKVGEVALDVSKKLLQVSAAISGALVAAVTAGVKSYAELEKAQKGSERLFGNAFETVKKNATKAYKTMGISAKNYYDQANTYAVGLKESLGGDAEKAAQLANDILVAQADIVAATGANADTVQNAFAAVMRGNFTLIDNLRLGVRGSKEGMQEVIDKVNAWNKAQGNATHYQMGNYADMQQAIIDYTKMVGVAGTAQTQLSQTITGSFSQMKSALDNFLNGTGGASDLSDALTVFLKNILKTLRKLAPSLVKGIVELVNDIAPDLFSMAGELIPIIIDGVEKLLDGLINFITRDNGKFIKMAVTILKKLVEFILRNLPILLDAAIKIVAELAMGIADSAPTLIPAIVECILTLVETLLDNVDLLIEAGAKLTIGIAEGLVRAIPKLIEKVPSIISSLTDGLKKGIGSLFNIGRDLIQGLWEGIKSTKDWLWGKIKGFGEGVVGFFKDVFSIFSPSKVMEKEIGQNLGLGIAKGIDDTVTDVEKAMSNLSSQVEASVNPTINPTANTNPLYVTIDKFYNNRETDIQQLAEELEFYRKNSALAKGGV